MNVGQLLYLLLGIRVSSSDIGSWFMDSGLQRVPAQGLAEGCLLAGRIETPSIPSNPKPQAINGQLEYANINPRIHYTGP